VERKRRDYSTLFQSISIHGLAPHVRLLLLGRCGHRHGDGPWVRQQLEELGISAQVLLWDDFIPVEEFHAYLRSCDAIMPLAAAKGYYEYRITGGLNLALGCGLPMIMDRDMQHPLEVLPSGSLFHAKGEEAVAINAFQPLKARQPLPERCTLKRQAKDLWRLIDPVDAE